MQKVTKALIVSALLVAVTSCSSLKFPGLYRINVQQGNIIEQDMMDQLEVGMTRRQVRYVMGSPLIEDTFNPDRWDYYYSLRTGEGRVFQKHVKVTFDGDELIAFEGDLEPKIPVASPEDIKEQVEQDDTAMPEEPFENIQPDEDAAVDPVEEL